MKTKIIIAATLVIVVWLVFLTYNNLKTTKEGESWRCFQVECTNISTGQEWVDKNCFEFNNQKVCKVNANNVDQLIPLQNLNVSLVRQCLEFRCIEEVKVRNVSYKITQ